jgi:ActR/RegA family two-component response regulator
MNGEQLAAAVKARTSETRVILLTGFDTVTDEESKPHAVDLILSKPATIADLRRAIHKVIQDAAGAE